MRTTPPKMTYLPTFGAFEPHPKTSWGVSRVADERERSTALALCLPNGLWSLVSQDFIVTKILTGFHHHRAIFGFVPFVRYDCQLGWFPNAFTWVIAHQGNIVHSGLVFTEVFNFVHRGVYTTRQVALTMGF